MDIQKENNLIQEAFEVEADEVGFCLDQKWGDYENPYENSDTALAFNLFKKGWQAAKAQAALEWISVEDELPTPNKTFSDAVIAWDGLCIRRIPLCLFNSTSEVTHWMPIPQPPKAQEPANDL